MNKDLLNLIERELDRMTTRSQLYHLIKKYLTKIGHWKNKPRGRSK